MKSEDRIQQDIVQWFKNTYCLRHHEPRHMIFHVANQTTNPKERMKKIAIGMMAGVSDLIVLANGNCFFVEVKDDKGRQQPKQIEFEQQVEGQGFPYIIVRSLDDFKQFVNVFINRD